MERDYLESARRLMLDGSPRNAVPFALMDIAESLRVIAGKEDSERQIGVDELRISLEETQDYDFEENAVKLLERFEIRRRD